MDLPNALVKLLFTAILLFVGMSCDAQHTPADSLTTALRQSENDTNRVLILRSLAAALINSDPQKATEYNEQAGTLAATLHFPKGLALYYDMEGNMLRRDGDYLTALRKHLLALRICDSIGYTIGSRNILSNTGLDYSFMKNYDKALSCFRLSLSKTDTSDHLQLIRIYNNIGNVYSFTGKYEMAVSTYLKALQFIDEDVTFKSHSFLYSSLATAYAWLTEYDKAIQYMHQALAYQQLLGDKVTYAASSCTLGGFYIEVGEYKKARFYLAEADKTAREVNTQPAIARYYYRNMAHLLFKESQFKQAYEFLAKYNELNDSLISEEHIVQMAEMESRFQVDAKSREVELLNKEKSLKEIELKQERLWKIALTSALIFILILLGLAYRNVQLKKKANRVLQLENMFAEDAKKMLEQQNSVLQHENVLAQYETLKNQVNPHFLFNSLNALSSLIKTDPEKAQQFTSVFSRLYRSVLELKDHTVITLAEELQLVDDYIYLQKIRFGESLIIDKRITAMHMKLYVPPFCIQMLIENAIKHNIVSAEQPLCINIYSGDDRAIISNNIQRRVIRDESTGTGIRNIIERFRILSDRVPEFAVINEQYIATIPFIAEQL